MIKIEDKRNDYKYYIDLDGRVVSIYWKLNESDYACIFDNLVPAKEGIIYQYEEIKDHIQPIKNDEYIKLSGDWYVYNVNSIHIKYKDFDLNFNNHMNHRLDADINFKYHIFKKNNKLVFWNGSSYTEELELLNFLKYLYEKDNEYKLIMSEFSGTLILN